MPGRGRGDQGDGVIRSSRSRVRTNQRPPTRMTGTGNRFSRMSRYPVCLPMCKRLQPSESGTISGTHWHGSGVSSSTWESEYEVLTGVTLQVYGGVQVGRAHRVGACDLRECDPTPLVTPLQSHVSRQIYSTPERCVPSCSNLLRIARISLKWHPCSPEISCRHGAHARTMRPCPATRTANAKRPGPPPKRKTRTSSTSPSCCERG